MKTTQGSISQELLISFRTRSKNKEWILEPSRQNTSLYIYESNHRNSDAAPAKRGKKYLSCDNPTAHIRSLHVCPRGPKVCLPLLDRTSSQNAILLKPKKQNKKPDYETVESLSLYGLCTVSMVGFHLLFCF